MAHLNPREAFDYLQSNVLEGIKSQFPVTGKVQTLTLDNLEVKDDLEPDDIRSQHQAKINGETWAVPVFANLTLKDNASGKVVDSRRIRIAEIPKTTSRYSYIVGGQEYQVNSQWQLKPGVYTKRRRSGELETRFNIPNKTSFDIFFDPASKKFVMEYGRSNLPLYPIMKTLGVSDEQLQHAWGKEIYDANKGAHKVSGAVEAFYKSTKKENAPSKEAAEQHLYDTLTSSKLRPDATEVTLGKPFDHVNGEAIRLATEKILKVQAGYPEDDRDSLIFKDLRTTGDFAQDILRNALGRIRMKAVRQVNTATNVRDIVKFDHFNEPLKQLFHKNAAANPAKQINPVEMVSSAMQTTIMGPGGIQSARTVNDEAKFVNPSHFGFLDPINSPEGEATGVTLRLPLGVQKIGKEPVISLYSIKEGKTVKIGPAEFLRSKVVLPDQVKWVNNKPIPLHTTVGIATVDNEMKTGKFEEAKYVMKDASQLFNLTSNLIPFLGNTSGNRAGMAARHIEQAISLVHRDIPLVQVASPFVTGTPHVVSFEHLLGDQASHQAHAAGEVVKIEKDAIHIKEADGKIHEVQIYNNYPLNDTKSVMHSTPLVQVGDKVKAGQTIADTNYSKKGVLALGANLRVGYLPFKGYNFEDGIVISRSAANKLESEHLHKPELQIDKETVLNKRKFEIQHPGIFTRTQLSKLSDDGVVRVGQRVSTGDPLIAASKPFQLKDRVGLGAIRKSMSGSHNDRSVRWDSDFEGEVVGVHKSGDKVAVHVRTVEPMQIGDKMAGRYGNKGIVTKILEDHEMPHTADGKHIEVALNPSGIPGRMNVGQVLEVAAGKIAEKTGKTYYVKNFEHGVDQVAKLKRQLKEHGLSDTEALFDPETKQPLGQVLIGPQHMIKLVHQIDKKLSVRSGLQTPGGTAEYYDQNLQPGQGGGAGGQSMGVLGMYALLAHGAKANLREMQTWKSEGPDSNPNQNKQWPSQHHQVWAAIQTGGPFPAPRSTFAFQKFTDLLRGAGINVEKNGHNLILGPMTDAHIRELAPNALPKASAVLHAKVDKNGELKPQAGGLFDEKLTGGHAGKKWTRMELAEPIPNPVFESAIQRLTGLKKTDYYDIVTGVKAISPSGTITNLGKGMTGGKAIEHLLSKINVDKDLESSKKELSNTKDGPKLDQMLKKVKYLTALKKLDISASEAYILHNLPIIPPVMRPISMLPNGALRYADLNGLYKEFAAINDGMKKETFQKHLTDENRTEARKEYYDGVKAIVGIGTMPMNEAKKQKGILHTINGANPKTGFFQETLMNRRQDLTMRSTIIPEPGLGLDEVGLPKHAALDLFKPFVVKKLSEMGAVRSPAEAPALIDKKTPAVWHALEKVMTERPVLLKRDPALHKYSVQAFRPRIVPGSAVQIHPLVTSGFNADFDGDSIDLDTPLVLRIQGSITLKTGRQLIDLLGAEDGNFVVTTKNIEAYTYNGWCYVKTVSFHEVTNKKKYRIILKNGVQFIASEDHSVMVGHREVKPTDLTIGAELDHVIPTLHTSQNNWSYDKGVAYGNFFGDGCAEIRRQGGGRISIACKPRIERDYLMDIWRKEFPKANPSEYLWGFHVNGVNLARHFLEVCGRYSDGKFVGDQLLNQGPEFLKGMLAGYILADGSVEVTRSGSYLIRTWSRSKQLRDGMSFIATMLGLPHALRERTAKGEVNYIISFGKEAIKLIDFRCFGKKGELIRRARHDYENHRQDARTSQSERGFEIQSIEEVEYNDRMIDLEVDDESHVFTLLGGVVVHNTMSVFVPITREAVNEAHKMFPSNNLFMEATGKVAYQPTLESALGLFKLSTVGETTNKSFKHPGEAVEAVRMGKLEMTDVVKLAGKPTTAGRILLAATLPEQMQNAMLYNLDTKINREGLDTLLTTLAKEHKGEFGTVVNKLKDIGNEATFGAVKLPHLPDGHAFHFETINGYGVAKTDPKKSIYVPMGAHSLSLEDFTTDKKVREHVLGPATKAVEEINADNKLSQGEKDRRAIHIWTEADKKMRQLHEKEQDKNPSNLFKMYQAGTKPGWAQYKQMVLAPMLFQDSTNRTIPIPVVNNYSEGLDVAGYWNQMPGARRGAVMKVQEVREPGYMSKLLMNNMMHMLVSQHDCGTTKGVAMSVNDKHTDIHDRYLAQDYQNGSLHVPTGTLLTPDVVGAIRANKKDAQLIVRSPLRCEDEKGLCQKCVGISASGEEHELGTNIGVISAHSVGERGIQLALKSFHTGGVVEQGGGKLLNQFARFQQLMHLPATIPNAATLAMKSGKIDKVEKDPTGVKIWIGGESHYVGKDMFGGGLHEDLPTAKTSESYIPWKPPIIGLHVKAGDHLSDPNRTIVNPRDLYAATGSIEEVQNHLANEVYSLYKGENVKRRHIETVVKAMSNLTKVMDPGDHPSVLRGEFRPTSVVRKMNKDLEAKGLRPIEHEPTLKGVDMLPHALQEDWMAKLQHNRLTTTLLEAASMGSSSNLHSNHPVPAIAFGAELGLTKKDSTKPGYGHLADVPDHSY